MYPTSSPRLAAAFVSRTSGDLALTNDASWHDVPSIGDLSIAAVANDVLCIAANGVTDLSVRFEVQFPNGPNYAGPGIVSTQGIAGWANRSGAASQFGGSIFYIVSASDVLSGVLVARLRYTTNSSGATKIFATTAVGPLVFGITNLGH